GRRRTTEICKQRHRNGVVFSPVARARSWTSLASGPDPAQAKPDPAQAKYAKNGIAMETLFSPGGGRRLGHRVQAQGTRTIRPYAPMIVARYPSAGEPRHRSTPQAVRLDQGARRPYFRGSRGPGI